MSEHTILLITTADNHVRTQLDNIYGDALIVADCEELSRDDLYTLLCSTRYDILITYRCRYIIPSNILSSSTVAINIHPSLLPAYAGLNPWDEMAENNETMGGVTLHRLTSDIDKGEILMQHPLRLDMAKGIEWNRKNADRLAAEMLSSFIESFTKDISQ